MTKSRCLIRPRGAGNIIKKGNTFYKRVAGQYEHRDVVERLSGRRLSTHEHVHHIDGNGLNNTPDNLQVLSARDHVRLHQRDTLTWDFDKALQMREQGATYQEIADALGGLHWSAIFSAFKSRGIRSPRTRYIGRPITYDIERAITLYQAGASVNAVALEVGCDPANLNAALRKRGIQVRGPKQICWDTDKALAMRASGATYSEIATAVGSTLYAVKGFILKQKRLDLAE